jgi:putative DNA-invertase from lambdoid prophage Rac
MPEKEKAVLYLRVSTGDQNYENQRPPLTELCTSRNFELSEVYAENESAWRAGHQHEWARLMHDAQSRRFTKVVVWSLDRITREGVESIFMKIRALRQCGVTVVSYQEQWLEPLGEMGDLFISLLAWVASFESRRRSERTLAGLARAKASGTVLGRRKGSRDKKRRKRSGYNLRYAHKND